MGMRIKLPIPTVEEGQKSGVMYGARVSPMFHDLWYVFLLNVVTRSR